MSPVVPDALDTLPLLGALSVGVHAFAMHAGSLWSQLPDAKHVTGFACDSVKPASQANQRDWPVVPDVLLMLPLPGACSAGAHGFEKHKGSTRFHEPDGKHTAALP
jgi:hypothetical protein